jgi:hypothetical protein
MNSVVVITSALGILAGAFFQATGRSPSCGWVLSIFDDAVSRNANVVANATVCRCSRQLPHPSRPRCGYGNATSFLRNAKKPRKMPGLKFAGEIEEISSGARSRRPSRQSDS